MAKASTRSTRTDPTLDAPEEVGHEVSVIGTMGCSAAMRTHGIRVRAWPTLDAALAERHHLGVRLIVVQPGVGGHDGIQAAVTTLRKELPLTDVILWAANPAPEVVRAAFRGGARDAVFGSAAELAAAVSSTIDQQRILPQLERLDKGRQRKTRFDHMVSRSAAMWDIFDLCVRVAPTPATVLILGETGTGKELLARAIHRRSNCKGRLVSVNCGAVPETLIDSELFGHVKGAYTGASHSKAGLFRRADGGTLFLDEIGNVPHSAQQRLLRVLQEGVVRPVGSDVDVPVNVRLVAATNASLEEEIAAGRFREDLYYRLDVMRIEIPPLRDRREDILFLFGHFSERFSRSYRAERPRASEGFVREMLAHSWPGNVRELENFTEKLTLIHPGQRVTADDFHAMVAGATGPGASGSSSSAGVPADTSTPATGDSGSPHWEVERALEQSLEDAVASFEQFYLEHQLARTGGRVLAAAEMIGVNRRTLLRKLKRYAIDKAMYRQD